MYRTAIFVLLVGFAGFCLAADRPQMPDSFVQDSAQSALPLWQLIPASETSRVAFGIDRWEIEDRSDQSALVWYVEAYPSDERFAVTSLAVEIGATGDITVTVQQGANQRSLNQVLGNTGQTRTMLTTSTGRRIDLGKAASRSRDGGRQQELDIMRSVIEVVAYVPELREHLPEVVQDLPQALIATLDSKFGQADDYKIREKLRPECFLPAATIASVAAAIQAHSGPGGLLTCVGACGVTAGCIYTGAMSGGIISTQPACWGAVPVCAGCGALGLNAVLASCSNMFWQEK